MQAERQPPSPVLTNTGGNGDSSSANANANNTGNNNRHNKGKKPAKGGFPISHGADWGLRLRPDRFARVRIPARAMRTFVNASLMDRSDPSPQAARFEQRKLKRKQKHRGH